MKFGGIVQVREELCEIWFHLGVAVIQLLCLTSLEVSCSMQSDYVKSDPM
ncbi:hypothetical protein KC19_4G018100 [Ceratodon purpureus]|uniref:Uncharacterized protein n=1 Tax=Ceratodon purpureus TaxID=3225 RepID=A0A8T0I7H2_CERPU|nr:hypothetical protein KC19_4G018100 [Ceratodon purpureus]